MLNINALNRFFSATETCWYIRPDLKTNVQNIAPLSGYEYSIIYMSTNEEKTIFGKRPSRWHVTSYNKNMMQQHRAIACRVLKHWHSGGCRYGVSLYTSLTFTSKGWQFVFGRSLLTEENKIIKLFAALYWSSKQQFKIIVFMSLPLEVSCFRKTFLAGALLTKFYYSWWWWCIVYERDE